MLIKLKNFDGAITNLDTAIELMPHNHSINGTVMAYDYRGEAKKQKDDLDGAIADYNKAIEVMPNDQIAYFCRGVLK